MSITAAELKWFKSEVITNTAANGGRMSDNEVVDGVKNNVFPDVSQAERIAGITRYRKVFAKLVNAANEVLVNPGLHIRSFTPAQDRIELMVATQVNTQADITGSEDMYGAGQLTSNVSAGATTVYMTLENAAQVIFRPTGNSVYIGDGTNQEYHTNVAASKTGDQVTLTLDSGAMVANNYIAANTVVASVIYGTVTELKPTFLPVVDATAGTGTYNDTTTPLVGNNKGAIAGVFTVTFTSATTFNCTEAIRGAVGSGNTSSDFAPVNTVYSVPFFTLRSAGWTGVWASGDTLTITTSPAALPIFVKQTVPAGTNSFSGDNFTLRFGGESA
jgi:hypothetical protein